jgi:hypothetical protein
MTTRILIEIHQQPGVLDEGWAEALAHHLSSLKGSDPDRTRVLSKVTGRW